MFFLPFKYKKSIDSQLLGELGGSWIWCSGPNWWPPGLKRPSLSLASLQVGVRGLGQWKLGPGDFASGSGSNWFQPLTRWSIWSPCVFIPGFRLSGSSSWGRHFPWPRHTHKAASPVAQSISGTMLATIPLARASHMAESKINRQENVLFSDRNCTWREFGGL